MSSRVQLPGWSREILSLRRSLRLSQADFAKRLNVSAMNVSRWERGDTQPTAGAYIRLGNLADDPLAWFFWGLAGLSTADIMRVLPATRKRLRQIKVAPLQVVHAGVGIKNSPQSEAFVAVPVLPVSAATLGVSADQVEDLEQLTPESLWAAPAAWCPNPDRTISLRVRGNSMSPLILDGYLIAVDTADRSREELVGKIVVAWNKQTKQLVVSRFSKFDHTEALVSDQRENQSVLLANELEWNIVGRVLWWAGRSS
jgi:transcriptional regulator with XRE-family HTH domain